MALRTAKKEYVCIHCRKAFVRLPAKKKHVKTHAKQKNNELTLLENGKLPDVSKIGLPFKGKNKIIIA